MVPISQSVCSWQNFPSQCYVTLQLTEPILRKRSVVNMVLGVVITTLHFLHNLQMVPISWSVCPCQDFSAQCYVTLQLIGPFVSVVNTTPVLQNILPRYSERQCISSLQCIVLVYLLSHPYTKVEVTGIDNYIMLILFEKGFIAQDLSKLFSIKIQFFKRSFFSSPLIKLDPFKMDFKRL